ncbi:hypothetical protein BDP27DRAFT_1310128, partial [Rhodocollybia butyracea]
VYGLYPTQTEEGSRNSFLVQATWTVSVHTLEALQEQTAQTSVFRNLASTALKIYEVIQGRKDNTDAEVLRQLASVACNIVYEMLRASTEIYFPDLLKDAEEILTRIFEEIRPNQGHQAIRSFPRGVGSPRMNISQLQDYRNQLCFMLNDFRFHPLRSQIGNLHQKSVHPQDTTRHRTQERAPYQAKHIEEGRGDLPTLRTSSLLPRHNKSDEPRNFSMDGASTTTTQRDSIGRDAGVGPLSIRASLGITSRPNDVFVASNTVSNAVYHTDTTGTPPIPIAPRNISVTGNNVRGNSSTVSSENNSINENIGNTTNNFFGPQFFVYSPPPISAFLPPDILPSPPVNPGCAHIPAGYNTYQRMPGGNTLEHRKERHGLYTGSLCL